MKIALVIPSYKAHFVYLERLCKNIAEQTRLPDLVVIRASSCDCEAAKDVLDNLLAQQWPFPLTILETPAQQYQAQNRNEGVAAVPSDVDVVSFFDSDDLMHPRRLEFLEQLFIEGAEAVGHDCAMGDLNEPPNWDTYTATPPYVWDSILLQQESAVQSGTQIVSRSEIIKGYGASTVAIGKEITFLRPIPMDDALEEQLRIHFGHMSVSRKVFTSMRFDEAAHGYEDTKYMSDIVIRRYKTASIRAKLSYYQTH